MGKKRSFAPAGKQNFPKSKRKKTDVKIKVPNDHDFEKAATKFLDSISVNGNSSHASAPSELGAGPLSTAGTLLATETEQVNQLKNYLELMNASNSTIGDDYMKSILAVDDSPNPLKEDSAQDGTLVRTSEQNSAAHPNTEQSNTGQGGTKPDDTERSEAKESSAEAEDWPPQPPEIKDPRLSQQVFTHRSYLGHNDILKSNELDYERLEFLGDSYMYPMCTRLVYDHFPGATVGKLATYRESLLKNNSLSEWSQLYGFDKKLKIEKGTLRNMQNAGKPWTKALGDIFEAYVAAIILSRPDDGWQVADQWLRTLWLSKLPETKLVEQSTQPPKGELAMKVLSHGIKLDYVETKDRRWVASGRQEFTIGVFLTGWGHNNKLLATGKGLNKAEAGAAAAKKALQNPVTKKVIDVKSTYDRLKKEEKDREGGPREDVLLALEKRWK